MWTRSRLCQFGGGYGVFPRPPWSSLTSNSRVSSNSIRRQRFWTKARIQKAVSFSGVAISTWARHFACSRMAKTRDSKQSRSQSNSLQVSACHRSFEGTVFRCTHRSEALGGLDAHFSVYVPDAPQMHMTLPYPKKCDDFPVLLFLSDMGCSDLDVLQQGNVLEHCSSCGLILVSADTSPRGLADSDGHKHGVGIGASHYVDATEAPWNQHYRMRDYLENELLEIVHAHFPTCGSEGVSVMGHGMGGMGALSLALRSPSAFRSVSAMAPTSHPTTTEITRTAFTTYLGKDEKNWTTYDPVLLMLNYESRRAPPPILLDVGFEETTSYVEDVVKPFDFVNACHTKRVPVDFRLRAGFDHSFFFVASVMEEHVDFHSKHLDDL
ncbi:unnamed protein product [Durusdinium trenchii]|uniref:S-formylglutathione hydrolase n=1 Tax=Durusdinium trenchii TaxID=1381693 RepID=A0ABP0N4K4_9DINO